MQRTILIDNFHKLIFFLAPSNETLEGGNNVAFGCRQKFFLFMRTLSCLRTFQGVQLTVKFSLDVAFHWPDGQQKKQKRRGQSMAFIRKFISKHSK